MREEQPNDCPFINVCQRDTCVGCLRYTEFMHLLKKSELPPIVLSNPLTIHPSMFRDEMSFNIVKAVIEKTVSYVEHGHPLAFFYETNYNNCLNVASKIMLRYFSQIWNGNGLRVRGRYVFIPEFLRAQKDFESPMQETERDILHKCDLIIFDGLYSEQRFSEFDRAKLMDLFRCRENNNKANIFLISTQSKEKLQHCLGDNLTNFIINKPRVVFR